MHCPKCGHEQISNEVSFCSRCGFDIELIPELIANEGKLSRLAGSKSRFWVRDTGVFISAVVMLLTVLLAVILALDGEKVGGIIGVIGFIIGVIGIMAAQQFLPTKGEEGRPTRTLPKKDVDQLSGAANVPAPDYIGLGSRKVPTTNELVQPPSITEPTTKLLQKDL